MHLKNDAQIIEVKYDEVKGKIKLHDEKDILSMSTEKISVLKCADDGSSIFKDIAYTISSSRSTKEVIAKRRLMTRTWSSNEKSKAEEEHNLRNNQIKNCRLKISRKILTDSSFNKEHVMEKTKNELSLEESYAK